MYALDRIAEQHCGSNYSYDESFLPDLMYGSWNMLWIWRTADHGHIDLLRLYHRYELRLRANKYDSDPKGLQNALEDHPMGLIRVCNEQALYQTPLTCLLKYGTTTNKTKKAVATTNAKYNLTKYNCLEFLRWHRSNLTAVSCRRIIGALGLLVCCFVLQ